MATCKNCLHLEACSGFVPFDGTIEEKADHLDECLKKPCKDFKNKADYAEVKHGYWNDNGRCSECDWYMLFDCEGNAVEADFCPYCGAKMDGERRDT